MDRDAIKRLVPGARVYRRNKSSMLYTSYRAEDGRKVRRSAGTTDEDTAWQVLWDGYQRDTQLTFREAVVDFFETKERTLRPNTIRNYKLSLQATNHIFGKRTLNDIDLPAIKQFVKERRRQVGNSAVRRDLAFLSTVFTHAQMEMTGAPDLNPFMGYSKRNLKEVQRDFFLTPEQFRKLDAAVTEEWHRVVLLVAVCTGMRHSEICNFRKEWIDWTVGQHGEIRLPASMTKSKRPRIIPIFPELVDTLHDWCVRNPSPWVFSRKLPSGEWAPYKNFSGFFFAARKRAGLKELRFHDLRHTFASWWVQRGGQLNVLQDMLGHASMHMVARYAHLDTGAAHRAVAQISGHTLDTKEKITGHTEQQ